MAGRINHRGWIVINSISSDDGRHCVDFFEHPEGGFGIELFRSDPEDLGRWTAIDGFSASRYSDMLAAADASRSKAPWLGRDIGASARFSSRASQLE